MAAPDDGSFISQAGAWIASAIAGAAAWLWVHTMGRISKLEEGKVNQDTFNDYVKRADKDRDERRGTELALFNEVKDLRGHFDQKIDKLADLIRSK